MGDQRVMETSAGYTATARALHWITAILVLAQIVLGIIIANKLAGEAWQDPLYNLHKSSGAVVIPIVLFRVFYRLGRAAAGLPADIPAIQRFAAHGARYLRYALVVGQVCIGWIPPAASRAAVLLYGLFHL